MAGASSDTASRRNTLSREALLTYRSFARCACPTDGRYAGPPWSRHHAFSDRGTNSALHRRRGPGQVRRPTAIPRHHPTEATNSSSTRSQASRVLPRLAQGDPGEPLGDTQALVHPSGPPQGSQCGGKLKSGGLTQRYRTRRTQQGRNWGTQLDATHLDRRKRCRLTQYATGGRNHGRGRNWSRRNAELSRLRHLGYAHDARAGTTLREAPGADHSPVNCGQLQRGTQERN